MDIEPIENCSCEEEKCSCVNEKIQELNNKKFSNEEEMEKCLDHIRNELFGYIKGIDHPDNTEKDEYKNIFCKIFIVYQHFFDNIYTNRDTENIQVYFILNIYYKLYKKEIF